MELLRDDEIDALILALADTRGDQGFTTEEMAIVLSWAEEARVTATLLSLVLKGRVTLDVEDGEVVFVKAPNT